VPFAKEKREGVAEQTASDQRGRLLENSKAGSQAYRKEKSSCQEGGRGYNCGGGGNLVTGQKAVLASPRNNSIEEGIE